MGIIKNKTLLAYLTKDSMSIIEIKIQDPKAEELPSELKNRLFVSKKSTTL